MARQERHRERETRGTAEHETSARHRMSSENGPNGEQAVRMAERMGERVQSVGREAQAGLQEGAREFAAMSERAFEAWMRSSNEAMRRVLEMNMELATWGREQLDDSINAVRSLAQCRTVGDAYGVQIGLMRSSMEKSLRHATNVFNMATRAMIGGMQAPQHTSSSAAQEVRQAD